MRKIFILIITILSLNACSYLDFDETHNVYTHDDMYRYFNKMTQMLTNVYSYIPQDLGVIGGAMRECGCDDAEFGNPAGNVQNFNNGNWSSVATVDTQWNLYKGIRSANEFLESIAEADYSLYKDNPQYENWMKKFAHYPYEARLLRAYYFFELARRYGDIAMPLKKLTIDEAATIGKTPFAQVIDFIVSECDVCASEGHLPDSYVTVPGNEFGRVTKGFAMAVKSKALLYAASKLHNPSMDKDKWKASAKAAIDIIDLGIYKLDPEDKANNNTSKEIVLVRMNGNNSNFELNNFPLRFTEGQRTGITGTYPTQNLVDAFQTKAGYDIILTPDGWETEDPDFDLTSPYENRDPRFARAVLANGMMFKGSAIEVFEGGKDYAPTRELGSPTGYYLRKYITETTSFVPEATVSNKHFWIIYRYAETFLTYAESMIEAFGDPDYKDDVYHLTAREALNQVRANASMPDVKAGSKSEFIEALRREWRVEFAFEDHRFWDIRRWCIGADTQTSADGVKVVRNGEGLEYFRIQCESRIWNERMNLYPIPQTELFNNSNLNPQNTGW